MNGGHKRLKKYILGRSVMNKKSLLLAASSLFICAALFAQDPINNRYSDDVLFGKQALDRIIAGNGTNIKKVAPFKQLTTPVTQANY